MLHCRSCFRSCAHHNLCGHQVNLRISHGHTSINMYMVVERGDHVRTDHPLRTADACDANICCRASDRSAWMTRYAGLMVQLVTSDPRVRRVVEAGGEATAIMSRLQALETKSHQCDDECRPEVQGHGSDTMQAACVEWREEQRIAHIIRDGIAAVLDHCMTV